ncbi:MAG: hypothetical protein JXQ71_01550 [Verrucomicrobia bacterium]|nr:hypothetical protein [Verrucomicrobiota bacterium]
MTTLRTARSHPAGVTPGRMPSPRGHLGVDPVLIVAALAINPLFRP